MFVDLRSEVDTYNNKLKYLVNRIYIENEPIDFDSKDFVETNELNTPVVITELPKDRKITVGMVNYKQEMLKSELTLSDNDVNDYFNKNAKVGDLFKISVQVNRRPNYVEGEVVEEPVEEPNDNEIRKTLKGKTIGEDSNKKNKKKKRNIDGYIESLEVTDVDTVKTEKGKYTLDEIYDAIDKAEPKQAAPVDADPIDENLIPF